MDKPQEGHDNQFPLVGRLSYRNGIGIIDAIGFSGVRLHEGRF